jgi:ferritin-like metal-binding protein YciE
MGETNMEDMLVSYMRDAHAMEKNVHKMLQSLISTTDEPDIKAAMEHHLEETQRHEELLRARLEQKGVDITAVKDIPAMLGAMAKSIGDMIRSDKPGKNARDAYVTESLEIAAYELLERTNIQPIVLEASELMGGISRTVNYKGNRIDIGGHRFF